MSDPEYAVHLVKQWLADGGRADVPDAPTIHQLGELERVGLVELTELHTAGGPARMLVTLTGAGEYEAARMVARLERRRNRG